MGTKLNFGNDKSKEAAKRIAEKSQNGYFEHNKVHSPFDAFMLLIKFREDVDIEEQKQGLENLNSELKRFYENHGVNLTKEQCFEILQGNFESLGNIDDDKAKIIKMNIFNCAMECLNRKEELGTFVNKQGFNTSSWMSHCLWEAELAGRLAKMMGLDVNKAKTLAILHDYGRKFDHRFTHVTIGFDKLVELGWEDEATACLTHSFLNGGRCANCDPAEEGFYLDENGEEQWENDEPVDDTAAFLKEYKYSIYDNILNISDLMALSKGIVSPYDRVNDIRTRKPADPRNEGYFLVQFMRKMNEFMNRMGVQTEDQSIKATDSIEDIKSLFTNVSQQFFSEYKSRESEIVH